MATVNLTKENFEQTIENNDFVIVDFWASWCGPCKRFGPTFEQVSEDHPNIVFAKVNTEEQPEVASWFQIRSIPTLMIFREKIAIFGQPGALPEAAFRDLIGQAEKVDMDDVRAKIAEAEAEKAQA